MATGGARPAWMPEGGSGGTCNAVGIGNGIRTACEEASSVHVAEATSMDCSANRWVSDEIRSEDVRTQPLPPDIPREFPTRESAFRSAHLLHSPPLVADA